MFALKMMSALPAAVTLPVLRRCDSDSVPPQLAASCDELLHAPSSSMKTGGIFGGVSSLVALHIGQGMPGAPQPQA
jgi:hypothetical protein